MLFALLVTTAAAPLLGACSQTNKLFSRSKSLTEVKMSPLQAASATAARPYTASERAA